jgi:hypothetical protein
MFGYERQYSEIASCVFTAKIPSKEEEVAWANRVCFLRGFSFVVIARFPMIAIASGVAVQHPCT